MSRTSKFSSFDADFARIVQAASTEILAAVRLSIADQVKAQVLRTGRPGNTAPRIATAKSAGAKAAPGKDAKPGSFIKRTPEQIKADLVKLVAYVKAHPGQRSEEIQAGTKIEKQHVASGLLALRDAKAIKMKGVKRAATYSA